MLDRVLANVGRVAPSDLANILLLDEEGGGAGGGHAARRWKTPQQAAWMAQVRMPVGEFANLREMVETAPTPGDHGTHRRTTQDGVKVPPHTTGYARCASAPIISAGEVIGFVILNSATPGFFSWQHAKPIVWEAFADQAGDRACDNARLFAAVQQHAAELEQRVQERTEELEQRRAQLQAILDSIGEGGDLR
ncbi:MAG: hypothetical protein KatS3mg051_0312 [Anaerolineae bacterium]|nr:MAG: hypothetical protein KatS3mg051_0312 [Anaerolineae bacterium]